MLLKNVNRKIISPYLVAAATVHLVFEFTAVAYFVPNDIIKAMRMSWGIGNSGNGNWILFTIFITAVNYCIMNEE